MKQFPTRTNQIPRHIPPPHWASHPLVLFLAAGLLPFGTIFVELYFAMTSIWQVRPPAGGDNARVLGIAGFRVLRMKEPVFVSCCQAHPPPRTPFHLPAALAGARLASQRSLISLLSPTAPATTIHSRSIPKP